MNSIRVTLTPEINSRLVTEYNKFGYDTPQGQASWHVLARPGRSAFLAQ